MLTRTWLNRWGYIQADENGRTQKPRVWAGGDIVTGSATVIEAMGAGRLAAQDIHRELSGDGQAGEPNSDTVKEQRGR